MECPSCHAEIRRGSTICGDCGATVAPPCPSCGAVTQPQAKFCSECGLRLTALPQFAPPEVQRAPVSPDAGAERRHLTVMFCDLVGSTTLASKLDPEDLRDVIGAYQRCVTDVVTRRGGFVARFLGDGALVYFGYPLAREDDAERAVHAGLQAVEAVSGLTLLDSYKPQVRIGIATGLCVVGASGGIGAAAELDVTGETPNLAARLQAAAQPNTVVIAAGTRRLTGGLFVYRDLGPLPLKGFAEPVPAWQVVATSGAQSRFDARREATLTPLLGRERELEAMLDRWHDSREGRGQVVLISGEPGIGKSRLTAMLQERLAAERHTRLRYFCSPDGERTPFYPFIKQLEHAVGLVRDDSPARKVDKLISALAAIGPPAHDIAAIADLLSLHAGERLPKLELDPRIRRAKTMDALFRLVELLARRQPVLTIFEDVQWIDPTSRELLDLAIERVVGWPVLLIVTFRPDFHAKWTDRPNSTALTLAPLTRPQSVALIEHLAGEVALPDSVVNDIVERSDGIPLFLEELTTAVLEARARNGAGSGGLERTPSHRSAVPATLHASLMARLDRLGAAKEIAQIGAAIGREFSLDLMAAVAQRNDAELGPALERLTSAGLLSRRQPPHATYLFKHALIRDAAYGTMLRDTRRALHRRIAVALERHSPDAVEMQPELLAHHCSEAGLSEKALVYWTKAGQHALKKSAMAEAIARLHKGLDLVPGLPESASRHQRELELQLALGSALIATKGYVAPDTLNTFSRARALCKQLNQSPQLVSVLHGQWVQAFMRNELVSARRRATELLELGEKDGDAYWKWTGYRLLGTTSFPMGEFAAGRECFEQSLGLHEAAFRSGRDAPADDETRAAKEMTFDEGHVLELAYESWTLLYLGHLDQARRRRDDALRHARHRSQAYTMAHAANGLVFIDLMISSPQAVLEGLQQLESLKGGHEIIYYAAMGAVFRGWCLAAQGQQRDGIAHINRGIAANRAMGTIVYLPSFLKYLAEAHGMAREPQRGLSVLAEATEIVEAAQARQDEAEIHRVRGELLAAIGNAVAAEDSLLTALAVARRQSARLLELRAAVSLARFWRERGRAAAARDHLAPVYGWFTEGHDTAALAAAKAVLDGLK